MNSVAAETTNTDAIEWVKRACDLGIGEVLINSIDADGTKLGFDAPMIEAVLQNSSVPVIADFVATQGPDHVRDARK